MIHDLDIAIHKRSSPADAADRRPDRGIDRQWQFRAGGRLRETELAETFEVSRATIREALRLLEQHGLVRIFPQRGAHVTKLSATELNDLFELRASLLGTGSRLAAEYCTPANAK